ncbi:MAG: hypothetical protein ACLUR5_00455 [Eubacterium ventriosum]
MILLEEKENNLSEIEEEAFVRELQDTIRDYNDITHGIKCKCTKKFTAYEAVLKTLTRQL